MMVDYLGIQDGYLGAAYLRYCLMNERLFVLIRFLIVIRLMIERRDRIIIIMN